MDADQVRARATEKHTKAQVRTYVHTYASTKLAELYEIHYVKCADVPKGGIRDRPNAQPAPSLRMYVSTKLVGLY